MALEFLLRTFENSTKGIKISLDSDSFVKQLKVYYALKILANNNN